MIPEILTDDDDDDKVIGLELDDETLLFETDYVLGKEAYIAETVEFLEKIYTTSLEMIDDLKVEQKYISNFAKTETQEELDPDAGWLHNQFNKHDDLEREIKRNQESYDKNIYRTKALIKILKERKEYLEDNMNIKEIGAAGIDNIILGTSLIEDTIQNYNSALDIEKHTKKELDNFYSALKDHLDGR